MKKVLQLYYYLTCKLSIDRWTDPRKRKFAYRTVCGVELAARPTKTSPYFFESYLFSKITLPFSLTAKNASSIATLFPIMVPLNNTMYWFECCCHRLHSGGWWQSYVCIYIYVYIYIYNMNADLGKSNPGIEPGTSCVKSRSVVITATTPTPLTVQFYTILQKFAFPVNIFGCTELNRTNISVGWPNCIPRFQGSHISFI